MGLFFMSKFWEEFLMEEEKWINKGHVRAFLVCDKSFLEFDLLLQGFYELYGFGKLSAI